MFSPGSKNQRRSNATGKNIFSRSGRLSPGSSNRGYKQKSIPRRSVQKPRPNPRIFFAGTAAWSDTRGCPTDPATSASPARVEAPSKQVLRAASRQMGNRCVGGNDQVRVHHQGSRVAESFPVFHSRPGSEIVRSTRVFSRPALSLLFAGLPGGLPAHAPQMFEIWQNGMERSISPRNWRLPCQAMPIMR